MTIKRQRADHLLPALRREIERGIREGWWRLRGDYEIIEAHCREKFGHAPGRKNNELWRREYAQRHGLDYSPLKTRKRVKRGPGRPKGSRNRYVRKDATLVATIRDGNREVTFAGTPSAVQRAVRDY